MSDPLPPLQFNFTGKALRELHKSNLDSVITTKFSIEHVCLGSVSILPQKLFHFPKCERYSGFLSHAQYKRQAELVSLHYILTGLTVFNN